MKIFQEKKQFHHILKQNIFLFHLIQMIQYKIFGIFIKKIGGNNLKFDMKPEQSLLDLKFVIAQKQTDTN